MYKGIPDVVLTDLFTNEEELRKKHPERLVVRLLRIRAMYNWLVAHPEAKDKEFIDVIRSRYDIQSYQAYEDLRIIKNVLPNITANARDYHRWKFNEMILDTYRMAKKRGDTKTMEKAASSYAKFNNINVEDEVSLPFDQIVVQPFTATQDPSVLGIKPIPNIDDKIKQLIDKYRAESIDIDDIEFEEADILPAEFCEIEEKETDNKLV